MSTSIKCRLIWRKVLQFFVQAQHYFFRDSISWKRECLLLSSLSTYFKMSFHKKDKEHILRNWLLIHLSFISFNWCQNKVMTWHYIACRFDIWHLNKILQKLTLLVYGIGMGILQKIFVFAYSLFYTIAGWVLCWCHLIRLIRLRYTNMLAAKTPW